MPGLDINSVSGRRDKQTEGIQAPFSIQNFLQKETSGSLRFDV
jgi:hypothetical protein